MNDLIKEILSGNKNKIEMIKGMIRYDDNKFNNVSKLSEHMNNIKTYLSSIEENYESYTNNDGIKNLIEVERLIEKKIIEKDKNNISDEILESKLDIFDIKAFGDYDTNNLCISKPILENKDMLESIENIFSNHTIDKNGLMMISRIIIENLLSQDKIELLIESTKQIVNDTIKYQSKNSELSQDFPIVTILESLQKKLYNIYDNDKVDNLFNQLKNDETSKGIIKESLYDTIYEYGYVTPYNLNSLSDTSTINRAFSHAILEIAGSKNDESILESINNMTQLLTFYEKNIIAKNIRKAGRGIEKGVNKIKDAQKNAHEIKVSAKKATAPITNFIDSTMNKIKKADENDRREIIIKQGLIPKLIRAIKQGILSAGVYAINPAAGAITLIALIGSNKLLDAKVKNNMLHELETELKLTREKIEDSRGDDNKQNKYELMKIERDLERTIRKIRLNMRVDKETA